LMTRSLCSCFIWWRKKLNHNVVPTPGLPDFSWRIIPKPDKKVPNEYKMYQMNTKCTKCS
jgi:hypothetical protein